VFFSRSWRTVSWTLNDCHVRGGKTVYIILNIKHRIDLIPKTTKSITCFWSTIRDIIICNSQLTFSFSYEIISRYWYKNIVIIIIFSSYTHSYCTVFCFWFCLFLFFYLPVNMSMRCNGIQYLVSCSMGHEFESKIKLT
jgi:hypothetical protein